MALIEEFEQQGNFLFRYRGQLPVLLLVSGLAVYAYVRWEAAPESTLIMYLEFAALGVSLLGLAVRCFTIGHTPKNTSGRNTSEGQVADELNTTGIYSLVRHPLYVGNFLMWLGIACYTMQWWFVVMFVLVYWLYYEKIMFAEEQFLRGKFGTAYLKWSENTPAFMPRFSGYVAPSLSFSWRNVLKREYSGLFNLFLVILLFELVGDYAATGSFGLVDTHWLILFGAATLTALVLRTLKKTTQILQVEGR